MQSLTDAAVDSTVSTADALSPKKTLVSTENRRVLAGHGRHETWPVSFWYSFSLHSEHAGEPPVSAKWPAAHGMHSAN